MRNASTLILMVLCCTSVAAQETTGDIRGRLRSTDGAAVVDATITASSSNLLGTRRVRSARDGVFQFLGLPPGLYTLRAQRIGFATVIIDSVRVRLGKTEGLGDIALRPEAAQLREVRVAAPSVTLDPARTTIGATLEVAELAALPADRDYKSFMAIVAHANTSYHGDPVNVGGATGLENMYFIDGVNVTAPLKGATGTSLPYNFVRSVEIRAGGYEAQYGRSLGAIVNAVTYSGTNTFEWNAFGFGTHDRLMARAMAEPVLRETGQYAYDVGLRVSGPLLRDRLWYSAAYNPRVVRSVRDVAALGAFPDQSRSDIFAGKITWQARPAVEVELSVFGDPTVRHAVAPPFGGAGNLVPLNPDPYLQRLETGGISSALRSRVSFGTSVLLEASVAQSTAKDNVVADTERGRKESPFWDQVNGTISGGMLGVSTNSQGITTATLRGTLTAGSHRAVAGAEYEDTRVTNASSVGAAGREIMRQGATRFRIREEGGSGRYHNRVPTAYLQDSWRVTDHLTINAGLRWARQRLVGASGRTAQQLAEEWQPRTGFSLHVDRSGSQRVFGSYGRFYQQIPLNLPTLYYGPYTYKLWFYDTDPRLPGAVAIDSVDAPSSETLYFGMAEGAKPERFDEYTLGYERVVGSFARLTVRGIHRHLGTAFQSGIDFSRELGFYLGTPGEGELFFLPQARRDYTALELALDGVVRDVAWRGSYVLSRSYGNFTGLYGSDIQIANPGVNPGFIQGYQSVNSTGRLPNDRPHVLKLAGSWHVNESLLAGAFFTWQSGTPVNAWGIGPTNSPFAPDFLFPRGSIGRLPAIRDLNVRLAYDLPQVRTTRGRMILDLLHLGNPQTVVRVDEWRYRTGSSGGYLAKPNADYRQPTAFAPPMLARLGIEIGR